MTDAWRANLVDDEAGLTRILRESRTVAVLGAKAQPSQAAGQNGCCWPRCFLAGNE